MDNSPVSQKQPSPIPEVPTHPAADPNPEQPDVFAAGPGVAAPTPFTSANKYKLLIALVGLGIILIIIFLTFFLNSSKG